MSQRQEGRTYHSLEKLEKEIFPLAEEGIRNYLDSRRSTGLIAENYYQDAVARVFPNLRDWLLDPAIHLLSPQLQPALIDVIKSGTQWEGLVNAFIQSVQFGTGGIRSLMGFDYESITALQREGPDARILKGPNTINNIVVLQSAQGIARYLADSCRRDGRDPASGKLVVGFDSRVAGQELAKLIGEVALSQGLSLHLFDEAVPYPEVTFAIPYLGADMGIFISASHNDYRYNGFKMSGANGAQISYERRDLILNEYINKTKTEEIRPIRLEEASDEVLQRLTYLGGERPLEGYRYFNDRLLDVHSAHVNHIKGFLLRKDEDGKMKGAQDLRITYSAFNGSGRRAVPRILAELGCSKVHKIASLDPLNGLFPAFCSDPGHEQQPDPGDPRAARIALDELQKDQGAPTFISWSDADLMIGTDPDADRCGVVVPVPPDYLAALPDDAGLEVPKDHLLIPADDMWALVLWYRLAMGTFKETHGAEPGNCFIAQSHTTSDVLVRLAQKFGLGVVKTWVGFGWLSTGVAHVWSGKPIPLIREGYASGDEGFCDRVFYDTSGVQAGPYPMNVATMEQSNGFSILGSPPEDPATQIGIRGHVRDKDGTFAALLVTEIAAYAKEQGTDILSLLAEKIYTDPDIGLFVNYYEPDPIDGEYPGIEGTSKKKGILEAVEAMLERQKGPGLTIAGHHVTSVRKYWTGKYDAANWTGFPDEGLRFYFGSEENHLTVRPSGTTNSLRFHVQLYAGPVDREKVWRRRMEMLTAAHRIVSELRSTIGAPRSSD